MAHTPGPWRAEIGYGGEWDVWVGDGLSRVATTQAARNDRANRLYGGSMEGNARLIAAAPDLLAACKALASCLRATRANPGAPCTWEGWESEVAAIIARAEGREPM